MRAERYGKQPASPPTSTPLSFVINHGHDNCDLASQLLIENCNLAGRDARL